jgi:hypothetical protein
MSISKGEFKAFVLQYLDLDGDGRITAVEFLERFGALPRGSSAAAGAGAASGSGSVSAPSLGCLKRRAPPQ